MQAVRTPRTLFPLLVIAMLALTACAPGPREPAQPAADPDTALAAQLYAQGDFAGAASLYQSLAQRTEADRQAQYLLRAADAYLQGGDLNQSAQLLQILDSLPLHGSAVLEHRLLHAERLLATSLASEALERLRQPPDAHAPLPLQLRYHRDTARAYRQLGNMLETANELQQLDGMLQDHAERLENQTDILRNLALLNEQVLSLLQPSPPGIIGGWMELALLVKRHGDSPDELPTHLAAWRQRFPTHPALPELLANYQQRLESQIQRAAHIAVLLPQTGSYAAAAAAIRDGIMISRFQQPVAKRPALRFYDSSDPNAIWPLYNQAVTDGAELVIGPLQKDAVIQLLRAGTLPVPVLALNQVVYDGRPPANMYLYALSPEDEARQAAERAWTDGRRRPVVLSPNDEWGARVAEAFTRRWTSLGGTVAGHKTYLTTSHDHSTLLKELLHLDASEARRRTLQQWLGQNLEFEPRIRADVDMVFLLARTQQAQSFPPQLQFNLAGDLPIYTTSHAWDGSLDARQAQDMKGMLLADIPWLLTNATGDNEDRIAIARHLPASKSGLARLYAMGMDAYRLVPHLRRLQESSYESVDGSTGNLYMDSNQIIHRQLVWVLLDEQPRIIGYSPRMDLSGNDLPELIAPNTPGELPSTAPAPDTRAATPTR